MFTDDQITRAIAEASHQFDLVPQHAAVAAMGENVVCVVTVETGDRFALRFHRPEYNTFAELESEAHWVYALDAAGLMVAEPMRTVAGKFHGTVALGAQERHVGVSEWLDGDGLDDLLRSSDVDRLGYFRRIGVLAARIRTAGREWEPPTSFTRRAWDAAAFLGDNARWGQFWQAPSLTEKQQQLFSLCRAALWAELDSAPRTAENFGLIHADLHLGNFIDTGDGLAVIDFDDAGYGWFEYELAVALHPVAHVAWKHDARAALLDGFETVEPDWHPNPSLIDTFLVVRHLMSVSWLADRPELVTPEQLTELVTRAEAQAIAYLDGL